MGSLRREVGFWSAVGHMRLRDLLSPEIAIGVAGSIFMLHEAKLTDRLSLVGDYLPLVAALLGIVFAALALVVALFGDEYLKFLEENGPGVLSFMRPFMFSIGLMVAVLLGSVGYRATAHHLPASAESWVFGVLTTLFLVAALDVVALARSVMMHGLARARTQKITAIRSERDQRRSNGR
jgi:hypothetical protein